MDEFFNSLKETHDIEKSYNSAEIYLKNRGEEKKEVQKKEMLTVEDAERIFQANLKLINKYHKIKDFDKLKKDNIDD